MTSLLDLHPDTAHPVLVGAVEIETALDRMLAGAAAPLPSGEYAAALRNLERFGRRLEAVKLKVVAAADRAGAGQAAGFTGTEAWTARHTNTTRTTAAREVRLATDLQAGHDATAQALDAGLVSPAHAAVILRAADQLPTGVTEEQRQVVEAALVDKAQRYDPDQLRRYARRAIEEIEPDQIAVDAHENHLVHTEEQAAHDRCSLTLHDNQDGTTTGHFTIPSLAAAILGKVIDSMTAPRRMGVSTGLDHRSFDWRHRRGLAFAELLEHLPTDHLHPKTAATVVVTLDHTLLHGALKTAGLDTGHTLTAGEARRLACGAGIIPAVLDSRSVTLDLGRETRLFTEQQRIAIGLSHHTCAAEGCLRPYAWCELHHREPWQPAKRPGGSPGGGKTDLDNALPLCHYHHQRIHDPGYHHRALPDGSISLNRRT